MGPRAPFDGGDRLANFTLPAMSNLLYIALVLALALQPGRETVS